MKKYIILASALCTMVLSGCYKEDPINAELEKYWRDYDVNSTDPALKFVSQYNAKFDKVLIYDADERDYLYNFAQKNDLEITNPTNKIHEKLLFFDELFMQAYNDRVKMLAFPYSVIIADKILSKTTITPKEVDFFGSKSFMAFKITDADLALDDAGKKAKRAAMHKTFILDFCLARGIAKLDPQFAKVSNYTNAGWVWAKKNLGMDIAYEKGFFYVQAWEDWDDTNPTPWRHSFRSGTDTDLKDYYEKLLSMSDEDMAALRAKWPLIDQKMGYFIKALESLDIDYRNLR